MDTSSMARLGACILVCAMVFAVVASSEVSDSDSPLRLLEEARLVEFAHSKLGRKCTENPPTLNSSSGIGTVVKIGGLNCYVSGSPHSKRAVLLASDVFGYEAPNLRKLADKVADAGFYVVVPDLFNGDPYDPTKTERPLPVWLASHDPIKASKASKPVIKALRKHGVSAVGVAGFCYGGKVAVELAERRLVEAGVLLHPSLVTAYDIKEVKAPLAILGAENDQITPPTLVKRFKKILSKLKIPYFVKIFGDVGHGWTLRYNLDDKKAVRAAEKAHKHMLKWFEKHIK